MDTETFDGRSEYETVIDKLKGSGLPEVMQINGYKGSDVDKLMSPGLGELANVYQNNLSLAMTQIEAQREAGIVYTMTVHTAMDAIREIGKITKLQVTEAEQVEIGDGSVIKLGNLTALEKIHLENLLIYKAQIDNPSPKWKNPDDVMALLAVSRANEKKELSRVAVNS